MIKLLIFKMPLIKKYKYYKYLQFLNPERQQFTITHEEEKNESFI